MDWNEIVIAVSPVVITLTGGWLLTARITDHWDRRKAIRNRGLSAMHDLSKIYGEFFRIQKLWEAVQGSRSCLELEDLRWSLLREAADVEGELEALIVEVAVDLTLTVEDIDTLAELRQAYKSLRQAICDDKPLWWWDQQCPQHDSFKVATVRAARLLASTRRRENRPDFDLAARALKDATRTDDGIRKRYGYYREE